MTGPALLELAGRLGELDDDALLALVLARGLERSDAADVFDLAEELADPGAVASALRGANRQGILDAARRRGSAEAERFGLSVGGVVLDEAAEQAEALVAELRLDAEAKAPAAPQPPLDPADGPHAAAERAAAERALEHSSAAAAVLTALDAAPGRSIGTGAMSAADRRRLAAAADRPVEVTDRLVFALQRSGAIGRVGGDWRPTAAGRELALEAPPARWLRLASDAIDALPPRLRSLAEDSRWGEDAAAAARRAYPAAAEALETELEAAFSQFDDAGLAVDGVLSSVARALLAGENESAAAAAAGAFPPEVDRVYLQHDLSAIAAGTLRADLEERLRGVADVESRAQATTYRFTEATVERALGDGRTAADISAFLESVSASGVPQPLAYLVATTADRFGAIVVASSDAGAGSVVRCADESTAEQLLADRRLAPLGFARLEAPPGQATLATRIDADTTLRALRDARHRATPDAPRAAGPGTDPAPAPPADDPGAASAARVVERLRGAPDEDAESRARSWRARTLERAARARETVTVTLRMPDGADADLVVEPLSVAAGRVRAIDRGADTERTLPLSAIVAVR